jgi:hypothetical protein
MTSIIEHLMKMVIGECVEQPSQSVSIRDENNKPYQGIMSWTVDSAICGWYSPIPAMAPFIEAMKVSIPDSISSFVDLRLVSNQIATLEILFSMRYHSAIQLFSTSREVEYHPVRRLFRFDHLYSNR